MVSLLLWFALVSGQTLPAADRTLAAEGDYIKLATSLWRTGSFGI